MGVSKNSGTPKWMVYNGKPGMKMDDLGVPLFLETSIFWILVGSWNPPRFCERTAEVDSLFARRKEFSEPVGPETDVVETKVEGAQKCEATSNFP